MIVTVTGIRHMDIPLSMDDHMQIHVGVNDVLVVELEMCVFQMKA